MTDEPTVPAGWYAAPANPDREQYWDGTSWRSQQRWRRSATPAFPFAPLAEQQELTGPARPTPGQLPRATPDREAGSGLQASGWIGIIVALSVLTGIAVLIVGVVLISHGRGARGAAVLVVGLLEAAFIGSFATLHQDVRMLRIQVADLSRDITGRVDRP